MKEKLQCPGSRASDRTLLVAIDALLQSGRIEAAKSVLERELGGG